jgi:hypothetical protein
LVLCASGEAWALLLARYTDQIFVLLRELNMNGLDGLGRRCFCLVPLHERSLSIILNVV